MRRPWHRMIYVSPDYRAKTSWMGPAADADLLQIIDDLHQKYRIKNVIVCGGSMGATSALAFAALHGRDHVDGVIAMNGTANMVEYELFQDAINVSYGGNEVRKTRGVPKPIRRILSRTAFDADRPDDRRKKTHLFPRKAFNDWHSG